jgi:hypothetical protein
MRRLVREGRRWATEERGERSGSIERQYSQRYPCTSFWCESTVYRMPAASQQFGQHSRHSSWSHKDSECGQERSDRVITGADIVHSQTTRMNGVYCQRQAAAAVLPLSHCGGEQLASVGCLSPRTASRILAKPLELKRVVRAFNNAGVVNTSLSTRDIKPSRTYPCE